MSMMNTRGISWAVAQFRLKTVQDVQPEGLVNCRVLTSLADQTNPCLNK